MGTKYCMYVCVYVCTCVYIQFLIIMQVSIAIEEVTRCHIRFTFRHRSSQECEY